MQEQILETKTVPGKRFAVKRLIKICLACCSANTCVNQYGIFCKDCGFLWDYE